MAEWYYTKGNDKQGPVSDSELKQLANSGQLLPTDLVWKDGAPEWKPASVVKGLFPEDKRLPTPPLPKHRPNPPNKIEPDSPIFSSVGEKWYQHPATIVISLLVCFPVGLVLIWTRPNWSTKHKWIWTGSFAVVMLLFLLSDFGKDQEPAAPNQPAAQQPAPNQPVAPISITADRLIAEYEANEIAADEKYKGKIIEVTGTIRKIGKDFLDNTYVALKSDQKLSIRSVECSVGENLRKEAASLSKGSLITIRGRCEGMIADIKIKNCEFVNRESTVVQGRENLNPSAVRERDSTGTSASNVDRGPVRSVASIPVTADRLIAAYEANEVAADEKYKGKIVEVTGIIKEIGKDVFTSSTYVALKSDQKFSIRSVQCFIGENLRKEAASLSKGSLITIRGRCEGMTADIKIKNCEFVKTEAKRDEGALNPGPRFPNGDSGARRTTNGELPNNARAKGKGKGTGLTIRKFRAEIFGESFTHAEFFRKYGKPDAIKDVGSSTYLFYTCSDGKVRVECPKAPYQFDDTIAPFEVDNY